MTNIYKKQMNKLGLNVKEYAQLLNMPYEVVKDFIYEKEGEYSMEIKNLLRRNMITKHQEVEQNKDNAKMKALEIKQNEINYLDWYYKDYTKKMLFDKLNLKSVQSFIDNYKIELDGKKASKWFYVCIVGKVDYKEHQIAKEKKEEFARQLYDIIVNNNGEKYLIEQSHTTINTTIRATSPKRIKTLDCFKWFKNFDFDKFLKENKLSQVELSKRTGISRTTLNNLIHNQNTMQYVTINIKKLYDYINLIYDTSYEKTEEKYIDEEILDNKEVKNEAEIYETVVYPRNYETLNEENKDTTIIEPKLSEENLENKCELQQEIYKSTNTNDEILRKILINRLTEEEKELIRIFGGKLC